MGIDGEFIASEKNRLKKIYQRKFIKENLSQNDFSICLPKHKSSLALLGKLFLSIFET